MAQSVKHLTLDFSLGHLAIREFEPHIRLCAGGTKYGHFVYILPAWASLSLSLTLKINK